MFPKTAYALRAARAIARDPREGIERSREKLATLQDERAPRPPYSANPRWEAALEQLLGAPLPPDAAQEFDHLWGETIRLLQAQKLTVGRGTYGGWDDADPAFARAVWYAALALRPRRVVETGVARGITTRLILEALDREETGRLWSIDIPPQLQPDLQMQTAVAVPASCRTRWTYVQGSSRRRLPRLLAEIGEIDLFVHDSMHTQRNMLFEFEQAWNRLKPGGLILADDIDRNWAFHEFTLGSPDRDAIACLAADGKVLFGVIKKPEHIEEVAEAINLRLTQSP